MNVRFAEQSVRVRVSAEEFESLAAGRALKMQVRLPREHVFRVSVRPHLLGQWTLESDPTGLWLSIPQAELSDLAAQLPKKEGLSHTFDASGADVTVEFEVDAKKPRGQKQGLSTLIS